MSNGKLVKIKTKGARINGSAPYLQASEEAILTHTSSTHTAHRSGCTPACRTGTGPTLSFTARDTGSGGQAQMRILTPVLVYPP